MGRPNLSYWRSILIDSLFTRVFAGESPSFRKIDRLVLQCVPDKDFDIQHCMELLLVLIYGIPKLVLELVNSARLPGAVHSWRATQARA
jgi:hypothetical protein